MKYQLFLYIFVLFITCTPKMFFSKQIPYINIIYALLFTIILYFTYYLVKGKTTEGYEYNLSVDGSKNFENIIDSIFQPNEPDKVNINVVNKHNGLARKKLKEAPYKYYEPGTSQDLKQSDFVAGSSLPDPKQPVFLPKTPPPPKECPKPEKCPDISSLSKTSSSTTASPTPIHLYKFKGNGSTVAMDTNDKQHIEKKNGKLIGENIKIEDDALTFSLRSIYSKSYLDLPVNITEGSKIITIETRVSTLDLNKGWARIFHFGKEGNPDSFFLHRWNSDDKDYGNLAITVVQKNGEWKYIKNTNIKFDSLNQAHIVLVLNGETKEVKLYVNRILSQSVKFDFDLISILNNTRKNYLGRSLDNEDVGFHGKIHEFAIWDIELTQELIDKRFESWTRESGVTPETLPEGDIVTLSQGLFTSWDNKNALSIFVDGEKDNAGGPSYAIFDNKKMTDKNGIVTFTAEIDTQVRGIFIGMGENGGAGYLIGKYNSEAQGYGGKGGDGNSGTEVGFNLKKGDTFTVQFDDKKGNSILKKSPQEILTLKKGGSTTGGTGGHQSNLGGIGPKPVGESSTPHLQEIIKTSKKSDGTVIFENIPASFGGAGGGAGGLYSNNYFGKSGMYQFAGASGGTTNDTQAGRYIRNYGAGGGGSIPPNGYGLQIPNNHRRYNGRGGNGGISGLILVTYIPRGSSDVSVKLETQRGNEKCTLNQSYGLLSDNMLWIKNKCDGIFKVGNNVFGCKGPEDYSLCIFKK